MLEDVLFGGDSVLPGECFEDHGVEDGARLSVSLMQVRPPKKCMFYLKCVGEFSGGKTLSVPFNPSDTVQKTPRSQTRLSITPSTVPTT